MAGFLSETDERDLLERFGSLDFEQIRMKGVVARHTARRYGMGYDYGRRLPLPGAEPIPGWLLPTRDRFESLAGAQGRKLVQVFVQGYPQGAPIGLELPASVGPAVSGAAVVVCG